MTIAVVSTLACATGLPTHATRVVQPEPGRVVELKVGEQIRIDAPNASMRWSLIGGDPVVAIAPAPGDRPAYWTLTGRQPGEAEITFEGAQDSVSGVTPAGGQPPAPPRLTFAVRVVPASD